MAAPRFYTSLYAVVINDMNAILSLLAALKSNIETSVLWYAGVVG